MGKHDRYRPLLSTLDLSVERKMEFVEAKIDDKAVVPTLATVIARCQNDASLSPKRRRDLVSALIRFVELAGVDPQSTPAAMPVLRPLMNKVRPARYGLSGKTWSNIRSNVCTAIVRPGPRHSGSTPRSGCGCAGCCPTCL